MIPAAGMAGENDPFPRPPGKKNPKNMKNQLFNQKSL